MANLFFTPVAVKAQTATATRGPALTAAQRATNKAARKAKRKASIADNGNVGHKCLAAQRGIARSMGVLANWGGCLPAAGPGGKVALHAALVGAVATLGKAWGL